MEDLIKALLFIKQFMEDPNCEHPTACDRDVFYVCGVNVSKMSFEDVKKLIDDFDFMPGADGDWDCFTNTFGEDFDFNEMTKEQREANKQELTDCVHSFRFGSC